MNSIILELSALENKIIDNTKIYGLEIHKKISEMLEVEDKNDLRVSNIFGEFFKKRIELEKNEKYKIRITTKSQEKLLKLRDQLFQLAINEENIVIGEGIFQLAGIITKNDIWCGEYDFRKEVKNLDINKFNFLKKINLKIVTPILVDRKSIFGFEKVLEIILKEMESELEEVEIKVLKEKILNFITVKREFYREKKVNLLNDNIKKVYIGDIEIELYGYYGEFFLVLLQYLRYAGIGEFKEYGFGEIILKS